MSISMSRISWKSSLLKIFLPFFGRKITSTLAKTFRRSCGVSPASTSGPLVSVNNLPSRAESRAESRALLHIFIAAMIES